MSKINNKNAMACNLSRMGKGHKKYSCWFRLLGMLKMNY